jgi:hypothetical protein
MQNEGPRPLLNRLSPELELAAACCAWPSSDEHDARIREAASAPLDWRRLQRIGRRQRVEGLIYAALTRAGVNLPQPTAREFRDAALAIGARALTLASESMRLQDLLADHGVASLVLKGAAVEMLAYGRLGLKDTRDIDLLVSPGKATLACGLLDEAGYELVEPRGLSDQQFATWLELAKECEFRHRQSGLVVELHWRLVDGPVLLPDISVNSPSQFVQLSAGGRVATLGREELFSYLCAHGAMHGWARLKWLCDLAAILSREGPDGIEQLYGASLRLGAGLCSAQALLLCEALLATTLPSALHEELISDARTRWLTRLALDMMTGGGEREVEDRPLALSRILLAELVLVGSPKHAVRQLRYRAVGVHDRTHLDLPPRLRFLYPWLRAPLWAARRLSEGVKRVQKSGRSIVKTMDHG